MSRAPNAAAVARGAQDRTPRHPPARRKESIRSSSCRHVHLRPSLHLRHFRCHSVTIAIAFPATVAVISTAVAMAPAVGIPPDSTDSALAGIVGNRSARVHAAAIPLVPEQAREEAHISTLCRAAMDPVVRGSQMTRMTRSPRFTISSFPGHASGSMPDGKARAASGGTTGPARRTGVRTDSCRPWCRPCPLPRPVPGVLTSELAIGRLSIEACRVAPIGSARIRRGSQAEVAQTGGRGRTDQDL